MTGDAHDPTTSTPAAQLGGGPQSAALFDRARRVIPGGVNSPVRAFKAVGGVPVFFQTADGATLYDVDGRSYIDYVGSWGPMILGHCHPEVESLLCEQARKAMSFGAPSQLEVEMAEHITRRMPALEQVRMVSTGTEAAMSLARLARATTGKTYLLKFEGCYHGHGDSFLSRAGSGLATLGVPECPGVGEAVARTTITARYNDLASVEQAIVAIRGQLAAILLEPVVGNMGVVPPQPGFLEGLREIATREDALLVFDEVITGFRVAPGGAQGLYGIRPDLTALGKIIGGGLPAGAYGGARALMSQVAPEGPVYQAGTLSGNPMSMCAGLATLRILERDPAIYARLEAYGAELEKAITSALRRTGVEGCVQRVGSLLTLFFTRGPVRDWDEANCCDRARYARFFHAMLRRGVYLPPSQFEAWFISAAHTDAELFNTIAALEDALAEAR